jgi:hypothetical protein
MDQCAAMHALVQHLTVQSHQQKTNMGILDNLENAWDNDFMFESKPMPSTDNMGRPTEEPNLAVKLFSETCCTDCS